MAKKHRILMLLENNPYPRDGRVRKEAQTLINAGYEVTVISPSSKDLNYYDVVDGVTVYRYPAPPEFNGFIGYVIEYGVAVIAMAVLSFVIWFRQGFSIIHTHNPPDFMVMIALFYKIFGVRFVFDHHDLAPEMYLTRGGNAFVGRILLFFEKLTCRYADHIIETNESYKSLDVERNQVDPSRISIVRNGPSQDMLDAVLPDASLNAKAPFILGYLGEIGANDGVDYLIRALDKLRDIRKDWYCIIIGDGLAKNDARNLAQELRLLDFVEFAGWKQRDEFLPLLSAVDIGVEPIPRNDYTNQSTMIKIMEYMALGLPIVAFDLDEHRASAKDAAIYATPNDEAELAQCISDLMDSPEKRAEMSKYGKARVQAELLWSAQAQSLVEAYDKLLSDE